MLFFIRKQLKLFFINVIGVTPLVLYMEAAMGIRVIEQFGYITGIGFLACMGFYAFIFARYIDPCRGDL